MDTDDSPSGHGAVLRKCLDDTTAPVAVIGLGYVGRRLVRAVPGRGFPGSG